MKGALTGAISQAMPGDRRSLEGAALEQMMFQSVASGRGPRSDAQLAIDRADMGIDGHQADNEPFVNLCAGQVLSK